MKFIKDFRVLYVPIGYGGAQHPLYVKENKDNSKANSAQGKTLFVGNVDFGGVMELKSISEYLTELFENFGAIDSISVSSLGGISSSPDNVDCWYLDGDYHCDLNSILSPNTTKTTRFAHVTFEKKSSMKFALSSADSQYESILTTISSKFGCQNKICGSSHTETSKHCKTSQEILSMFQTYSHPGRGLAAHNLAMKERIEETLKLFEEQEHHKLHVLNDGHKKGTDVSSMDDDGFTTVKVRRKQKLTNKAQSQTGSATAQYLQHLDTSVAPPVEDAAPENAKDRKKRKNYELENFYAFQKREKKQDVLLSLREKFEEDKAKIALMKQQRKFKAL